MNAINTGDIIAIIVAVISLIGVIVSTIITNKTTKKINDRNIKMNEEWNQKNIDANIVSQARIAWIQNVRNVASELLVHYFSMLNLVNKDDIDQELFISQEKNELLILYFGNDSAEVKKSESFRDILLNEKSNKGKNNMLVMLLMDLSKRFAEYSVDIKNDKMGKMKQEVADARRAMYSNVIQTKVGMEYIAEAEAEEYVPVYEQEYQSEDVRSLTNAQRKLQKENDKISELQKYMVLLRDAIRIYLKIEWEIAKTGK